jgi:hypothetical protein
MSEVWILESGMYEEQIIEGVFSSPEKAMAIWSPKKTVHPMDHREFTYTWSRADADCYVFDADWGDSAAVTRYEVDAVRVTA